VEHVKNLLATVMAAAFVDNSYILGGTAHRAALIGQNRPLLTDHKKVRAAHVGRPF